MEKFFIHLVEEYKNEVNRSRDDFLRFLDSVEISKVKRAMLGIRFLNDEESSFLVAAGESINHHNSARQGELIEANFSIGDGADSILVTLQGQDQYNNLEVEVMINLGETVRIPFEAFQHSQIKLFNTPSSLSDLKYGTYVYAVWKNFFGQALGKTLIRLGSYSLQDDLESYVPALQETWDLIAHISIHDPEGEW